MDVCIIMVRYDVSQTLHYENTPMQYTENYLFVKMRIFAGKILTFFLFLLHNIDCVYMLEPPQREAVLKSNHNLCFGAKISKIGIGILLHTPILLYKNGV